MSFNQMKKMESNAPTPVLAPDESGKSQPQEDPTRSAKIMEANSKATTFRERLNEIRAKLKEAEPQVKEENK